MRENKGRTVLLGPQTSFSLGTWHCLLPSGICNEAVSVRLKSGPCRPVLLVTWRTGDHSFGVSDVRSPRGQAHHRAICESLQQCSLDIGHLIRGIPATLSIFPPSFKVSPAFPCCTSVIVSEESVTEALPLNQAGIPGALLDILWSLAFAGTSAGRCFCCCGWA